MNHHQEPTLHYLETLQNAGARLTDFEAIKINTDLYRVIVYLDGESPREFIIKSDPLRFRNHFREAVGFTGYGSRGLGNLIYADACEKTKEFGVAKSRIRILLSDHCYRRIKCHFKQWTNYGFQIHIQPSIRDFGYAIELISDDAK
jgi:hypothetical protein